MLRTYTQAFLPLSHLYIPKILIWKKPFFVFKKNVDFFFSQPKKLHIFFVKKNIDFFFSRPKKTCSYFFSSNFEQHCANSYHFWWLFSWFRYILENIFLCFLLLYLQFLLTLSKMRWKWKFFLRFSQLAGYFWWDRNINSSI